MICWISNWEMGMNKVEFSVLESMKYLWFTEKKNPWYYAR